MEWFRMYSEFANDPKVQSISEAMQRRLVMLLCLRCSNTLVTLQEDEIAFALRITETELAETKAVFVRKGFINDQWEIQNWEKRQFVSDSSASRVAKHRAKAKEEAAKQSEEVETACNVTVTPQIQNRTDTEEVKALVPSDAGDLPGDQPVGLPAKPTCPHQEIIDLYHEILPQCPQIRDWTPARQTQLRARWNEDPKRQNLAYWRQFFEYVRTCDFLVGKSGKQPFFADLEWMTKSCNFTKIREEKYANRT